MEWNLEAGEEVVKQVGTVFIGHDDPLREAISERENQKGMEEGALYKRNPIALCTLEDNVRKLPSSLRNSQE